MPCSPAAKLNRQDSRPESMQMLMTGETRATENGTPIQPMAPACVARAERRVKTLLKDRILRSYPCFDAARTQESPCVLPHISCQSSY
jgi:hypothetical protein